VRSWILPVQTFTLPVTPPLNLLNRGTSLMWPSSKKSVRNNMQSLNYPFDTNHLLNPLNLYTDCSTTDCSIIAVHPDSTRFLEFTRTFNWHLKVQSGKMFQLDFPYPGMRQIKPSESCPDKHTYIITTYQRVGPTNIGSFCRNGTISRIQVLYKGRVTLEVPKGTDLNPSDFKVSMGPAMDVKLPRGAFSVDFFTPDYLTGYYDEQKMKWNFAVKPMHNFTVRFQHYTPPECQKKTVMCDYALGDKTSFTVAPTETQPANKQGDFSLTLTNCDTKKVANVSGLSLNFNVEVFRSGTPCKEKFACNLGFVSEIINHFEIHLPHYFDLFPFFPFLNIIIDCPSVSARDATGPSLTIPTLDLNLPVPLHQFTWLLRLRDQSTVDLMPPKGSSLHQSVPDKQCNERVSLLISETEGSSIGQFCSAAEGTIQKIQIKGNVSITVLPSRELTVSQQCISVFFTENVIYTVSPLISGPMYLATPNWPDGMNPSSSASWIITIPQEYKAELLFSNVSKPKCDSGHTEVSIGPLDSQGQTQSWREDQSFTGPVVQQQSFYLNMSNCEPKSDRFAIIIPTVFPLCTEKFLSIILAIVGALLLLVIIAVIVVCVIRKKNKPNNNRSSIFMPRGKPVLPGNASFPKTRADNESHVYASIDDPTMYGHLVDKNQPAEVDSGAWNVPLCSECIRNEDNHTHRPQSDAEFSHFPQ
uniref:CUB domain containing protein 1a n=1 Tax=Cyprinus carpio carpio TaxID=630221 RepID=A0A9J8AYC7_CYPCA